MSDRDDFIRGLRDMADLYEADPFIPLPGPRDKFLIADVFSHEAHADVATRLGATGQPRYTGKHQTYEIARREFGPGVAVEVWTALEPVDAQ